MPFKVIQGHLILVPIEPAGGFLLVNNLLVTYILFRTVSKLSQKFALSMGILTHSFGVNPYEHEI